MENYKIISDTSCDILPEYVEKYDIDLIPYSISFDKVNYKKDMLEISTDEFYAEMLEKDVMAKTSLPAVTDYLDKFVEYAKKGIGVICFTLSTYLSGSYQAAVNAKEMLLEDYPNAVIEVIDSTMATAGQALVVLQCAKMREAGYSFAKNVKRIKELLPTARIEFTVEDLKYLQMGGRIGKAKALAGSVLNLKPMLEFKEGEVHSAGLARGKKKSFDKIIEATKNIFEERGESFDDYDFVTGYGVSYDEVVKLTGMLEKLIGKAVEYPVFRIGVTVGNYTGPRVFGLGFIKKFDAQ
ncbi:MAG: DegV family protein [Lachnospiraceae bacterium]|nr:DegV family protein [Lachnospiraceae bacterium]